RWLALDRPRAERFWPQADIVFCTAESYVPAGRARVVVTLHDAAYFEANAHRQDFAFRKQQWKWTLLYRKLVRKADLFHTVSAFSAERLAHYFPEMAGRLRVVPNGVAPHFFTPGSAAGRAYLASIGLAERPFVLVPGGLHYRKNAELILAACPELLRRCPGLVVAVSSHAGAEYRARARSLGPAVQLLGFVPDDALHALYSAAQVVWFPSRYEGFGMPVLEAMACGAPVVASDASSIPEIAGGAAVLVPPASPAAHVEALCALLTDARACGQLREAGRERAGLFSWADSAAQLKHCMDTLL
ncbi:MAG TPA: glycosyltransferase family 1 protein, partial [Acidobacteriaceae bacterium]